MMRRGTSSDSGGGGGDDDADDDDDSFGAALPRRAVSRPTAAEATVLEEAENYILDGKRVPANLVAFSNLPQKRGGRTQDPRAWVAQGWLRYALPRIIVGGSRDRLGVAVVLNPASGDSLLFVRGVDSNYEQALGMLETWEMNREMQQVMQREAWAGSTESRHLRQYFDEGLRTEAVMRTINAAARRARAPMNEHGTDYEEYMRRTGAWWRHHVPGTAERAQVPDTAERAHDVYYSQQSGGPRATTKVPTMVTAAWAAPGGGGGKRKRADASASADDEPVGVWSPHSGGGGGCGGGGGGGGGGSSGALPARRSAGTWNDPITFDFYW
jgi:hypothetical protein